MPIIEVVIEIKSRLRQCFLGPIVAIDQNRIANANFLKSLIELLVKFDTKTSKKVLPIVTKTHSKIVKTKNTTNSRFVTKMLINILRAMN